MTKNISALNRVMEFCNKNGIVIGLQESTAQKDENTLIHIPGIKIIVSYKEDASKPTV